MKKDDIGCAVVIVLVIAAIVGGVVLNYSSEIDEKAYEDVAKWSTDPSQAVQKKLTEAAANGKISKWEYHWIWKQRENDEADRSHTDARQKALDAISKPK